VLKVPPGIKPTTKITGIFGDPVSQSLSPKMHNYAFKKMNLDYFYVPFLVKPSELKSAVDDIRKLNLVGVNVTIPHKEAILPLLDDLTDETEMIGAVNTVVNRKGRLRGHNTDGIGFIQSLYSDAGNFIPENLQSVVIWGAGGVARAMANAMIINLKRLGTKHITIINRTYERAENLVQYIQKVFPVFSITAMGMKDKRLLSILRNCNVFINTTPVGVDDSFPVHPEEFLSPKVFVYDAVYAQNTPLLIAAKKAGAPCLGGLGMLIRQGAQSFKEWTGVNANKVAKFMKESLVDHM